jgi:hypothetical protein
MNTLTSSPAIGKRHTVGSGPCPVGSTAVPRRCFTPSVSPVRKENGLNYKPIL